MDKESTVMPVSAEAVLAVEVRYAAPGLHWQRSLQVPVNTSILQALQQSGIAQAIPGLDLGQGRFGVFGKLRPADSMLRAGDRIEVYRPLIADPKDARRRRAAKK